MPLSFLAACFLEALVYAASPLERAGAEAPLETNVPALMSALCEDSSRVFESEELDERWFCQPCPSYAQMEEGQNVFAVGKMLQGHFSSPAAVEAVISMNGCHAREGGGGGTVYLRKSRGTWSLVAYLKGLRFYHCLNFTNPLKNNSVHACQHDLTL